MMVAARRVIGAGRVARQALLDPESESLLEQSRGRNARPLSARERVGEALVAGSFIAACLALVLLHSWPETISLPLAAGFAIANAVASRVRFELGSCNTDASQLVLVPMLFALPPVAVLLVIAVGNILADLPEYRSGERHPQRAVRALGNSWYAVGPALVFAIAGPGAPELGDWSLYVLALGSQFLVDNAVSAPREWFEFGASPRVQLPIAAWTFTIDALLSPLGLLAAIAAAGEGSFAYLLVFPSAIVLALFAHERRRGIDGALALSETYRGTTQLLAELVEHDDEYTGLHSQQVVTLALAAADALALEPRRRRNVEFAALLHDVGKLAVPKEIINANGPLDDEEWAIVKRHTLEGQRMLDRVGGYLTEAGAIVRSSHERWDGQGYPDGLTGDAIPIEARIVSCCDAFDAMTTDRPYRAALPVWMATEELRECAGTQFDPQVAEAVIEIAVRAAAERASTPAVGVA